MAMQRWGLIVVVVLAILTACAPDRPSVEELQASSPWWKLCGDPNPLVSGFGMEELEKNNPYPPGLDAVENEHGDTLLHYAARGGRDFCLSNLILFRYHSNCATNDAGLTPADLYANTTSPRPHVLRDLTCKTNESG